MKRVFILGAGFSKPAGMPLATELLPLLAKNLELEEMQEWLDSLGKRLCWLAGANSHASSYKMNIEEVFHYAHFDIEVHRLRQHQASVGRGDGSGTPWNSAESIDAWLSYLEDALRDVVFEEEDKANLQPIARWANALASSDTVVTFNYDTLVERTFTELGVAWNHAITDVDDSSIRVFKLHGSIDWIVAHRSESFSKLDLLFDKENSNRSELDTGHVEDDYRLWRCRSREQLRKWISDRDVQFVAEQAAPSSVGIAGLGAYKQLHQIPGLGQVWAQGMRALREADLAVVVGFSMSDFDAMAQLQFASVAQDRTDEGRPLRAIVIDPILNERTKARFHRVFRSVAFEEMHHEVVDWASILGVA